MEKVDLVSTFLKNREIHNKQTETRRKDLAGMEMEFVTDCTEDVPINSATRNEATRKAKIAITRLAALKSL